MNLLGKKILLLLLSGIALGYSRTPHKYLKVLKSAAKEWGNINKKELKKKINDLYESKLVKKTENSDGTITIKLTQKGRLKAMTYEIENIKINKTKWDGRWRIIIFDIPEKLKKGRNALREKLKTIGFYELQKSVLVCPYECQNEIDFLIEFFELRKYVRFGHLISIDNEPHLKKIFDIQ